MKHTLIPTRTVGPVSARFLGALKNCGKTLFTLDQALDIYGKNRQQTIKFLSDLVKRGVLARIKSGVYLVLQIGAENTQLSNWPNIAHQLAGNDEYTISHYSAMRLHGMTTHPLVDVFITITKRHRPKKIGPFTYHFIYSKPEHFWGSSIRWITRQDKVYISDIEKTILDALERPDLCGGIKEVIRGIWAKQNEIDWKKMATYSAKFRTKASIKRLGFILETLGLGSTCIPSLIKSISVSEDYIFLDPNGAKKGSHLNRWHIRLNMNIDELKASIWG